MFSRTPALELSRTLCIARPPSFPPWQGGMKGGSSYGISKNALTLFSFLFCLLTVAGATQAQTTYYVDDDGTSTTCTGWGDACPDLQTALGLAVSGDQIWVAIGIYEPTTGTDRTATFELISGVAIYGGFDGTETSLGERAGLFDQTILSGILVPEDDIPPGPGGGTPGETCDLAGAINYGETDFDTTGALTDGPGDCLATQDVWYIHTAGYTGDLVVSLCDNTYYDTVLAIYDTGVCPPTTLLKCNDDLCDLQSKLTVPVVEDNDYLILVGGIDGETGAGEISISYETGVNSYHVVTGNGIDSTAVLDGFTITGGKANGEEDLNSMGGGMFNSYASPTVVNCRFRENRANGHGGGIGNWSTSFPSVTNCTFSENSIEYTSA